MTIQELAQLDCVQRHPHYLRGDVLLVNADCRMVLAGLPEQCVNCCVTSPPYFGLRDYGHDDQLGMESTPDDYVQGMLRVFYGARHAIVDDGTLWLNLGDSYNAYNGNRGASIGAANAGHHNIMPSLPSGHGLTVRGLKPKDLIGIPWRVAFALQSDGWYLRQDIIWHKTNPMPESVQDRCTKAHEYIFMLSKSARYHYDANAIAEPATYSGITGMDATGCKDAQAFNGKHRKTDKQRGHRRRHDGFNDRWDSMTKAEQCGGTRNKRDVWTVATKPFPDAHFATFPPELIEPCILAGCPDGGVVLDPFGGSGTTAVVARRHGRGALLIELSPAYFAIACKRVDEAFDQTALIDPTPPATVSPGLFDELTEAK